ncbi:hypothetical protein Ddc_16119 [Ditylenchus destructor]|nr:hypothetical protein Ddc_16119 [Ditylenchus destructor]
MFKNSKDDWPDRIIVNTNIEIRPALLQAMTQNARLDVDEPSERDRRDRSIMEYIWPNAKEICPDFSWTVDLHRRLVEIVHTRNLEDGRRLTIEFDISHSTTVDIELTKVIHPIDSWLNNVSHNHISVSKNLEYSHPEKQVICPEELHKQLFSFLEAHIRNSVVSFTWKDDRPSSATRTHPGLPRLIKDIVKGQLQRNCTIICIYRIKEENVLNYDISHSKLGKASLLPSDDSFNIRYQQYIQPTKDANGIGPYMKLVDHCQVIFSNANCSLKPQHSLFTAPGLTVTSHFHHNFPEQFIEIFKHSRKDDWPEQIVVKLLGKTHPFPYRSIGQEKYPDINELRELERRGRRSLLEYIWPNAKEICPDLREKPLEIVHPKADDGRRLVIEFAMNLATPGADWCKNYDYVCSFTFKTISVVSGLKKRLKKLTLF